VKEKLYDVNVEGKTITALRETPTCEGRGVPRTIQPRTQEQEEKNIPKDETCEGQRRTCELDAR
jgi:hypothetical protein